MSSTCSKVQVQCKKKSKINRTRVMGADAEASTHPESVFSKGPWQAFVSWCYALKELLNVLEANWWSIKRTAYYGWQSGAQSTCLVWRWYINWTKWKSDTIIMLVSLKVAFFLWVAVGKVNIFYIYFCFQNEASNADNGIYCPTIGRFLKDVKGQIWFKFC